MGEEECREILFSLFFLLPLYWQKCVKFDAKLSLKLFLCYYKFSFVLCSFWRFVFGARARARSRTFFGVLERKCPIFECTLRFSLSLSLSVPPQEN